MADIFVSYRRDDSRWSAGRINDHLVAAFGSERIFFDTLTMEPGADFHEVIGSSVGECRVLLAVIGPGWLKTLEERATSNGDFVCVEIAEALRRGVRVVPLLIDGAAPPTEDMLPPDLKPLARRHAITITPERCPSEIQRLVGFLKSYLGEIGSAAHQRPGAPFRDTPDAPEMVAVPSGAFLMGAPPGQDAGDHDEGPQHEVHVPRPFAVGRYAVTVAQFDVFVESTGYAYGSRIFTCDDDVWRERNGRSYRDPGFSQSAQHPAVGVSWADALTYCAWLSRTTGRRYHLLSEAQWEYCCRAGSTSAFAWGPRMVRSRANYDAGGACRDPSAPPTGTVRVDDFAPNAWGLYQMHGNIWEWCEDTWHDSYDGAPCDGSSWQDERAALRVVRGGSWMSVPTLLRSATRNKERPAIRMNTIGFRVARALEGSRYAN